MNYIKHVKVRKQHADRYSAKIVYYSGHHKIQTRIHGMSLLALVKRWRSQGAVVVGDDV